MSVFSHRVAPKNGALRPEHVGWTSLAKSKKNLRNSIEIQYIKILKLVFPESVQPTYFTNRSVYETKQTRHL